MTPTRTFYVDALEVQVHATAEDAGRAMAKEIASRLRTFAAAEDVNIAFASAPSQDKFLDELTAESDLPWARMNAFQLEEYIGLPDGHPSSSLAYLTERLAYRVPLRAFYPLFRPTDDPSEAVDRYIEILGNHPLALACTGIGENGRVAFNDPNTADLNDPAPVKRTSLDLTSRRQQVFDGAFPRVEDVPAEALTLTLPSIMAAREVHAIVPGVRKAAAVKATLEGPIDNRWPATAFRSHPCATLYLDEASASLLSA